MPFFFQNSHCGLDSTSLQVSFATTLVAIQILALCDSFEFRRPRCKQLNPYREPFFNTGAVTRQKMIRQEQFLGEFAKYMSAKMPQLLRVIQIHYVLDKF